MKILFLGNFDNSSWDGSITDELHIANALRDLEHEVIEMQRENLHFSLSDTFDFILIAQWYGYPMSVCQKLRESYKCPVIYWAFDYQFDSGESWHFEMAKEADLFLSKELNNKAFYESIGAKFHWLPQDFAPEFLKPPKQLPEKKYDVVFTGTYLPQAEFRNNLLKAIDAKYDLHIFSVTQNEWRQQGFKNVHPPIMDEGLPELYNQAKINISCDWKVDADGYWSDRLSQILACGGIVINKYVPYQEIIYPREEHFNTIEECLSLVEEYTSVGWVTEVGFPKRAIYVKDRVRQLLRIVRYRCLK